MCLYYEDRGPTPQTPLPVETKAGKCIEAGFSQLVSTGGENVLFQAGLSIDLGPFFTAEPGFVALIEPGTCVADCEDCCDDWNGFTLDEIPNGYSMNFGDSDPTNDIFQVTDVYHPFCAFNAKGYHLRIYNQYNNTLSESSSFTSQCCSLSSPAPENQITHSSIWWNGYTTDIFGNQIHPNDGTYFYHLKLYGCFGVLEEYQGFIHILSSSGMIVDQTDPAIIHMDQKESITASVILMSELETNISLSPNPANNYVQIIGIDSDKAIKVQLFDAKGLMIEKELQIKNGKFDVSKLNSGTYFCKIFIDGTLISKKFVKI